MPEVTVVVPNWNRRDLIERLIDRFRSQTLPPKEILVVDNGSTDGSAQAAAAKGARVIALERNVGFTGAVNRAIPECRTEWIAIVNNDVEPAADWLEQMLKATVQPRVWFVTGKLVDAASPDSLDGTYDVVCRGACAWRAGHGRPDGPLWRTSRRIRIAPFTAALFRAELFQKVGLLDERSNPILKTLISAWVRGIRLLRRLHAGCGGAACRQFDAGRLASRHGSPHGTQPGSVGRQALPAALLLPLLVVDHGGATAVGCAGRAPGPGVSISQRQMGKAQAFPHGPP